MSSFLANPFKKPPPVNHPVDGFGERIKNIAKNNFRGLIGVLVPLVVLLPQASRFDKPEKLRLMWLWMIWFYLVQPVSVPATSLIPVFFLPMAGIMNSNDTCKCFMNDNVMLYILTGYLIVLLNNSGLDKRIALWFVCSGDAKNFSASKLVFKASTAAFFLSIFSSRLIATFNLTQLMTEAFGKLSPGPKNSPGPDFTSMNHVINNAVQTSAGIGGTAILHSSFVNVLFRGTFHELVPKNHEYPDIFNYLQYSAFAFPLAFIMFIVNLIYHTILVKGTGESSMTEEHMLELQRTLLKSKAEIPPKLTLHEQISIVFAILILGALFTRWNTWFQGWGYFSRDQLSPQIPRCKDTTICAIFVIVLHILPKSFGFLKLLCASKKSELPVPKPESAILWWRFVDKNVNYGYIFTFGTAFSIVNACLLTGLDHIVGENIGKQITNLQWELGLCVCVLVAAILCNLITAMAACAMWLPFVLIMSRDGAAPWPEHVYIAALGVGIACNFGFCVPFQYTPAFYCHHTGKVPILKMVRYSIPTVLICFIVLMGGLVSYASSLWDPTSGFNPLIRYNPLLVIKPQTTLPSIITLPEQTTTPEPPPPPP